MNRHVKYITHGLSMLGMVLIVAATFCCFFGVVGGAIWLLFVSSWPVKIVLCILYAILISWFAGWSDKHLENSH